MSAISKQEHPPPPEPPEPKTNTWGRRIRNYSVGVLVIFVLSAIVEKCIEFFSEKGIEHLRHLNEAFINSVDQLKPWNLAKLFYAALLGNGLFEITSLCSHTGIVGRIFCAILNTPYAVFLTIKALSSQGPVSILTAAVAFLVGVLATVLSERRKSDHYDWRDVLGIVLFAPLIGSCFMWALLGLMHLASFLFGWMLVAAGTIAGLSVTAPLIGSLGSAVVKEREHSISHKIVHGLTRDGGG